MQKLVVLIKKIETNMLKIKIIEKLGITVNIQGNIEVLHVAYVIQSLACLKKFLWFFIMDLIMITILSQKK